LPDAENGPHDKTSPGACNDAALPGTLVLVVGPSGAGKDTLIDAARAHFRGHGGMVFCERIITRAEQTSERHLATTEAEFAAMRDAGAFLLAWEAHGLHYGIAADVVHALREGKTVVANVSRTVIGEARRIWPYTQVIQVTARSDVRLERLRARKREPAEAVAGRLARGEGIPVPAADWVHECDNSGDLAEAVARFNAILASAAGGLHRSE
jgi:ribose 1,5-bisphosphokinase